MGLAGARAVAKQLLQSPVLSGLLRIWERRFAVVIFGVGPGLLRLGVGRPPASYEAALAVAAERYAISDDDSDLMQLSLSQIADDLFGAEDSNTRSRLTRQAWELVV